MAAFLGSWAVACQHTCASQFISPSDCTLRPFQFDMSYIPITEYDSDVDYEDEFGHCIPNVRVRTRRLLTVPAPAVASLYRFTVLSRTLRSTQDSTRCFFGEGRVVGFLPEAWSCIPSSTLQRIINGGHPSSPRAQSCLCRLPHVGRVWPRDISLHMYVLSV